MSTAMGEGAEAGRAARLAESFLVVAAASIRFITPYGAARSTLETRGGFGEPPQRGLAGWRRCRVAVAHGVAAGAEVPQPLVEGELPEFPPQPFNGEPRWGLQRAEAARLNDD